MWRLDHGEPFGDSPPDENPSGLGVFKFPLRHGGWQYADEETGEFWNWMRTYSRLLGRYDQSDTIGLGGGLNTYLYGNGDPLRHVDPRGEAAEVLIIGGTVLIVGAAIAASSPAGRKAMKSIAQKIADVCTPSTKDPCDQQQEDEERDCWNDYGSVFGRGHFSYRGCMDRAKIRGDLCRRGLPQPPQWSDADVTGQPRGAKPPKVSK